MTKQEQRRQWLAEWDEAEAEWYEKHRTTGLERLRSLRSGLLVTLQGDGDNPRAAGALNAVTNLIYLRTKEQS